MLAKTEGAFVDEMDIVSILFLANNFIIRYMCLQYGALLTLSDVQATIY